MTTVTNQISQIIAVAQPTQCTGAEILVENMGGEVLLQLRSTVTGQPGAEVLAQARLVPNGNNARQTLRGTWAPVLLSAATEYAIVVECADINTSICIAQIGAYDAGAGRWMTAQPYQVGLFALLGTDGAWIVRPDTCLAFSLLRADYTSAQQTHHVGTVAVNDASDIALNSEAIVPEAGATCAYTLTLDNGDVHHVDAGQNVPLGAMYSGNVAVHCTLRRGSTMAAVLEPGCTLVVGSASPADDYISTMFDATGATELRVTFKAQIPAGSSVLVDMQNEGDATWQAVPYQASVGVAGGMLEITHSAAITGTPPRIRIRVRLQGTPTARPIVNDLFAVTL